MRFLSGLAKKDALVQRLTDGCSRSQQLAFDARAHATNPKRLRPKPGSLKIVSPS